jgi:fatty acid/phospholipid biosynthesis enzyme
MRCSLSPFLAGIERVHVEAVGAAVDLRGADLDQFARIAGAMSKLIVDARLLVHRGAF